MTSSIKILGNPFYQKKKFRKLLPPSLADLPFDDDDAEFDGRLRYRKGKKHNY